MMHAPRFEYVVSALVMRAFGYTTQHEEVLSESFAAAVYVRPNQRLDRLLGAT